MKLTITRCKQCGGADVTQCEQAWFNMSGVADDGDRDRLVEVDWEAQSKYYFCPACDEAVDITEAILVDDGDECPWCGNGTVEIVDGELRCRGECGTVWHFAEPVKKFDPKDFTLGSSGIIRSPGTIKWAMEGPTFDKVGGKIASRLYLLAGTMPDVAAGVLLDIALDRYTIEYSGDSVRFIKKEEA